MKIKRLVIVTVFLSLLFSAFSQESMVGMIYRQDSIDNELLYVQKEYISEYDNIKQISHRYYLGEVDIAAYESVVLEDDVLIRYETAINELNFTGQILRVGDKLKLTRIKNNKTKIKEIKWKEGIIVGPMLPGLIKTNVNNLENGERIEFHLPYFDILNTIPIILERKKGTSLNENGEFIVEMKLKNFFLRLLIDTIEFVVDSNTGSVREIHGPTILPEPGKADPKKLIEADIYYTYNQ